MSKSVERVYEITPQSGVMPRLNQAIAQGACRSSPFANHLWDNFEGVTQLMSHNIVAMNDVAQFWKQRAAIEAEYAKALAKLAKGFRDSGTFADDPAGWFRLLPLVDCESSQHSELAVMIEERLYEPLKDSVDDLEANHKLLSKLGKSLLRDTASLEDAAQKSQNAYMTAAEKADLAAEVLSVNVKAKEKASKIAKAEKDLAKKQFAREETFSKYSDLVDQCNETQRKYYGVLTSFGLCEERRAECVLSQMDTFSSLQTLMHEKILSQIDAAQHVLANIHPEEVMRTQADRTRLQQGSRPSAIEVVMYEPGSLSAKSESKLRKLRDNADISTQVFGAPLAELMERQEATHPDVQVPLALQIITDALLQHAPDTVEGIFRVPGDAGEIQAIKEAMDAGATDINPGDAHVAAALFKVFLRDLPTPVIPDDLYNQAIAGDGDPEAAIDTIEALPPVNRCVLEFVVQVLVLLLKPEVVDVTKMNSQNLAIVFAPGILRCPTDDPMVMVGNQPREQRFVETILKHYYSLQDDGGDSAGCADAADDGDES